MRKGEWKWGGEWEGRGRGWGRGRGRDILRWYPAALFTHLAFEVGRGRGKGNGGSNQYLPPSRYETYLIPAQTLIPYKKGKRKSVSPWYWICLIPTIV